MSEYVPTTDEVRADYVDGAGEYRDVAEGWFDRWLAQVRAEAWDAGYDAGEECALDTMSSDHECIRNPYRTGTGQ